MTRPHFHSVAGTNLHNHTAVWHDLILTATPSFPDALCASHVDPDLWFANSIHNGREDNRATAEAKSICHRCTHRTDCLAYALDQRIWSGIWGGTTELERKAMTR